MVGTGSTEDVLDLLDLTAGPLAVGGATHGTDGIEDGTKGDGNNGLLIDDVQLVGDGRDGEGSSGGEDGGLGDQGVAGKGVDQRLGLRLRILLSRDARVVADRDGGRGGLDSLEGRGGGSETGGAWVIAKRQYLRTGKRCIWFSKHTREGPGQAHRHCEMSGVKETASRGLLAEVGWL